jgi:cell division protein FtsW (lipid II flippase)
MPTRFLLHTILLILAAFGVYVWLSLPGLSIYTLQLVALLVLLYLGSHWLRAKKPRWFHRKTITVDITILTTMILLLVTETGALTSPLFFLTYFLLFAVSLLYEIEATLVLTGVFILYFLFLPGTTLTGTEGLTHLAQIISLIMITPLAILTGHQYEKVIEEKRENEVLAKHLGDEESDILMFLSLNLKKTLLSAIDSLSQTIPLEHAKEARTNLQNLYQDLKNLYRSADELEQTLDREADK